LDWEFGNRIKLGRMLMASTATKSCPVRRDNLVTGPQGAASH
jgi:hypothetical protein